MTDYVFLIVGSMVTIICIYFIAAPFFKTDPHQSQKKVASEEGTSIETIYAAINELEMDYLMKKITEADFQQMKMRYQIMAAEILKIEEEQVRHEIKDASNIDEDILIELQKIRKQKGRQIG
ncbi:hypothetical protein [Neobacillus sp. LXY-4]|uniref:hypothetical protein n=1 Tax=Neobacillus sp. LXY-4 TaxID=3379826 RepID=UPI003EDE9648